MAGETEGILRDNDEYNKLLSEFDDCLNEAENQGLSQFSQKKINATDLQLVRSRTLGNRLWMLGYLDKKTDDIATEREINYNVFKIAVKKFHDECNTTKSFIDTRESAVDETWLALDRLVNFEPTLKPDEIKEKKPRFEIEKWYSKDKDPNLSLKRAIQLRLFALGLVDEMPGKNFKNLPENWMEEFKTIIHMLDLDDGEYTDGDVPHLIEMLFDQDKIVEKIALNVDIENVDWLTKNKPKGMSINTIKQKLRNFCINVAKIELWLHGVEGATIDGNAVYETPPESRRNTISEIERKKDFPLYHSLCLYWDMWKKREEEDNNLIKMARAQTDPNVRQRIIALGKKLNGTTDSRRLAENISNYFFISLHCVYKDSSDEDPDYAKSLATKIENKEIKIEDQWEIVKKKGCGLWDGVKRVLKWIKKQFMKVIEFFKNIASAVFRYAADGFEIVKTAVNAVVETIQTFLDKKAEESDLNNIYVSYDKDFDQTVFVNLNADPEKINSFLRKWEINNAKFSLGSKIIGIVISTLRNLLTSIIGWFKLVVTLLKSLKSLIPLYKQLIARVTA